MNDKIIINTISKIHFTIISIFSFIYLTLFFIFIILQNGLYIDTISTKDIQLKKLYIKWDEKISLTIKEVTIKNKDSYNNSNVSPNQLIKSIKNTLLFTTWFHKITIDKISYKTANLSFSYVENGNTTLNILSDDFILKSSITSEKNVFNIKISELKNTPKNISIDGNVIFDLNGKMKLYSLLHVALPDNIKLKLYLLGNTKKLSYLVESKEQISSVKKTIALFGISDEVKYWIDDAIEMTTLSLESLYGQIEYKNIDKAYLNLYAKGVVNDLTYTYDEKLEPVKADFTSLEFKRGVLYIKPQNAYSYNFFLDKSWLKIDFTKKEELLTLYLLLNGQLNKDILSLLQRYGINLPIMQKKGELQTDLTLDINLISLDVEAIGSFYTKEAQIEYLGLDIDIFNTLVFLKNSSVEFKNATAKYKDIATSHLDFNLDAKESKGQITFSLDNVSLWDNTLNLLKDKKPLVATYTISPKEDLLTINKSEWNFGNKKISIEPIKTPFDVKTLIATIPKTKITSSEIGTAFVNGDINFKNKELNLDIFIENSVNENITFPKEKNSLSISYDENFTISSKDTITFDMFNQKCSLKNILIDVSHNNLDIKNANFYIKNSLKTKFNASYDLNNSEGYINLDAVILSNKTFGEIFGSNENIELLVKHKDDETSITSKKYDFSALFNKSRWSVDLNSIDKIEKKSDLLKEYGLNSGYIKIHKEASSKNIQFDANLTADKYKILTKGDELVDKYEINGEFDTTTDTTSFQINNLIYVHVAQNIDIKAYDTGFNLDDILNFLKKPDNEEEEKKSKNTYLDAKNCYIYVGKNRHVISDEIKIENIDDVLTMKLKHKDATANFKLTDEDFYFYGNRFNDEFMEKLFALSNFKDGSMEFSMHGQIKNFSGVIYVENTTILDYKVLNNVLAFVNTVPSLVTFSLPGYNKNGIAAKNAYIKFDFKDDIYNFSDIYLKSKELEIAGFGQASTKENSINVDLNLKSDLGSSISKIPLLGHILLGKESVSTTLKITGKLDDPDVDTQIAKDIAVAPLNIIKRTIMYPFEIFKSKDNKSESKEDE